MQRILNYANQTERHIAQVTGEEKLAKSEELFHQAHVEDEMSVQNQIRLAHQVQNNY